MLTLAEREICSANKSQITNNRKSFMQNVAKKLSNYLQLQVLYCWT